MRTADEDKRVEEAEARGRREERAAIAKWLWRWRDTYSAGTEFGQLMRREIAYVANLVGAAIPLEKVRDDE